MSDTVSIVLPIYNGEKYMRLSIDSILSQSYNDWELIIIDDCSIDNTSKIAKEYAERDDRISYYRNDKNLKLPKSLNRGFSLAKGNFLTWTSDDNIYLPHAIEKMVAKLKDEGTQFVFATCDIINENEEVVEIIQAPSDYKRAIIGNNFVGACFMYTRKVYETIGDYNSERFLVEDYDYWLRVFAKFDVSNIQEKLYLYRWHSGALTSTEKKERINRVCEDVILSNISLYGKLDLLQKYYLYNRLHNLRQTRVNKREKNIYRNKAFFGKIYYLFRVRFVRRIKRLFSE